MFRRAPERAIFHLRRHTMRAAGALALLFHSQQQLARSARHQDTCLDEPQALA
jgi:hypothetical protein